MTPLDIKNARELKIKIDSIVKRYNYLTDNFQKMKSHQNNRDFNVEQLTKHINSEILKLKTIILNLDKTIKQLEFNKKNISNDFKTIVKKEQLKKLEQKIDSFKFEELIWKDQLYRELNE